MTALAPHNTALADQVLAVLREQWPLPVSTPAIYDKVKPPCHGYPHTGCGPHLDYQRALNILNRLARDGQVEKITLDGMRPVYWRRWPEEEL